MPTNPWDSIAEPDVSAAISAKRVDSSCPWDFFWGRALGGKYLFVVQHAASEVPKAQLPRLRGIRVKDVSGPGSVERMLVFELQDSMQWDLFRRLCLDVVAAAADAAAEEDMVQLALARTWRWHHLLRGGSDGRLSESAQQGLLGELRFVESCLASGLPAVAVMDAWMGPSGSDKDFAFGRIAVEVKSRRISSSPKVSISTESQLDDGGLDGLFLVVFEIERSAAEVEGAICVTDVASRVRDGLVQGQQMVIEAFESRLAEAGFRWTDDYSDCLWLLRNTREFAVSDGFPRIVSAGVPSGVGDLKYTVSLAECAPFEIQSGSAVRSVVVGMRHVD
jgi:hypothetical protein